MLRPITKQILLSLCSGLFLAFSFPWVDCWLLAWFAFIPLFYALEGVSFRRAFSLSFAAGFIFWIVTIYWLIHITAAGLIILAFYLALYFGAFGVLISQTIINPRRALLAVPAVWVLLEFIRSHFLTGFGWALLAYSQYRVPACLQIADLSGAWGVSFLVMTVNCCLYALLRENFFIRRSAAGSRGPFPWRAFSGALVVICFTFSYGFARSSRVEEGDARIRLAVIQPNIPQELKWDPRASQYILKTYFALTESAVRSSPDLIIWPEAAFPGIVGEDDDLFGLVRDFINGSDIPVLFGAVTNDGQFYYNSALLVDRHGELSQFYHKQHLVPFGEYIPLRDILPFLQAVAPIGEIEPGGQYTLFGVESALSGEKHAYGVLICFEDLFPQIAREFVRRGAGFLVNITNDAWYKNSPAAKQHFMASVLRAVENRRWLVRVTNTGVTGVIAADGSIRSILSAPDGREIFTQGIRIVEIPSGRDEQSVYTRFPYAFIVLCALIVLIYEGVFILRAVPYARRRR